MGDGPDRNGPEGDDFEQQARAVAARVVGDADLDSVSAVFNLVRASTVVIARLEREVHRPAGWTWAGFRMLFSLLALGPAEPSELARRAGVTRASTSSTLNTLQRHGLVRRVPSREDRRRVTVELTSAGRAATEAAFVEHHRAEQRLLDGLSAEERAELARLLARLLARVRAHAANHPVG